MITEAAEMREAVERTEAIVTTETVIEIAMEETVIGTFVTEGQTTDTAVKVAVALRHHLEMDQRHLVDVEV